MAENPGRGRFTNETPQEREQRLEIQREQRRKRRQQETAEQREYRVAQRRQRDQHSDHKHVQRQRQNVTITLQTNPVKRGNSHCRRFRISGNA